MRAQQLFENINGYDFSRACYLASAQGIAGGWEVWLQVELALFLKDKMGEDNINFERERIYREFGIDSNQRCDFLISYGGAGTGGYDNTFIELKCQNPYGKPNPLTDALKRFQSDIEKVRAIPEHPIIACMLVCYGTIDKVAEGMVNLDMEQIWKEQHIYLCDDSEIVKRKGTGEDESEDDGEEHLYILYVEIE